MKDDADIHPAAQFDTDGPSASSTTTAPIAIVDVHTRWLPVTRPTILEEPVEIV